jgi:hypothetical protein
MKNIIFALILALTVFPSSALGQGSAFRWRNLFGGSGHSQTAPAETSLARYVGVLSVQTAADAIPKKVNLLPYPLHQGDQLRLGPDAGATIVFKDMSQVRLGPGSVFVIEDEEPARTSLSLILGKIWVSVTNSSHRSFEVRTRTAIAAVRGTRFSVEVSGLTSMVTEVYAGAVAVSALDHGVPVGAEVLALLGQRVEVVKGVLGAVRTMIKAPPPPQSKPAAKAEVEERLRILLAKAEARGENDSIQVVEKALAEGQAQRMQATADAIDYSASLSKKDRKELDKAFSSGEALDEAAPGQSAQSRRADTRRRDIRNDRRR